MAAKIILKFDILPEEKQRFDEVCNQLHIKKVDFLRQAITEAEAKLKALK